VLAFARRGPEGTVVAVAPRFVAGLLGEAGLPLPPREAWADTRIACPPAAGDRLRNLLTGATLAPEGGAIPAAEALAHLPVALLLSEAGS
jgi:maltooligosyltrehalose synthase